MSQKHSKVLFRTYGCTFNKADTDAMENAVFGSGRFAKAENANEADIVVLNTCSVKDSTQEKILHEARKLQVQGKKLVVAGCLAQASPKIIEEAVPQASILGTFSSAQITDAITAAAEGSRFVSTRNTGILPFNATVDGVIARIQISRGCLGMCTYCSTKLARGRLESFPPQLIEAGVRAAVERGAKEIQLTSQDAACYGFDLAERTTNLAQLVQRICSIPGRFRVRIGMGNPEHFSAIKQELAKAMESEKVYKFLHVPVQSGSDRVLEDMKRNYTAEEYAQLVEFFKAKFADLTLETDIIVGFPTEAEEDFEDTLELMRRTKPTITNVSKYSARPGTQAARMRQVDKNTVKRRSTKASRVCKKIGLDENGRMNGARITALVTERGKKGYCARAPNYRTIVIAESAIGMFVEARVTGFGQSHLKATLEN